MRLVKVLEPGLYTTVQDAGRFGWLRYGLPPSGAMDRGAFEAANALVGNDACAAVLECTGTLPILEFDAAARVSVVYADRFQVVNVSAGEPVELGAMRVGYRAYVGMDGGVDVPLVMGSRSTYVPGKLGGFEGRVLRAGDVLEVGDGAGETPAEQVVVSSTFGRSCVVRVIPGPEADWFDCGGLNRFLTEEFTVSSTSNRTGIRLEGPPLSFQSNAQMVSAGIGLGTIQVPPSGQPIIMMADHPTTGGYPRIGSVAVDDLPFLAQLKPGDRLRFGELGLG